ncbi:MAG TPA: type II secretion system protein N [Steroidobacteraceae bacterium]|nr:type II secretion system protein N [Steroidobacteraceae bacterium]
MQHLLRNPWWRAGSAPAWAAVGLIGLGGADILHMAHALHSLHGMADPKMPAVSASAPGVRAVALPALVAAHLFGAPPVAAPMGAANAPDTNLPYTLSGVLATADPRRGAAILAEQGEPAHVYQTDEPVGQGSLFEVFADRVVLQTPQGPQTLRLPGRRGTAGTQALLAQAAEESPPENPPAPTVQMVSRGESLFSGITATLSFSGAREGMVLHPNKRYQRVYGLRNGDVLTEVNGTAITDPDSLKDVLKSTDSDSLSLTVIRDGVPQTISLAASN